MAQSLARVSGSSNIGKTHALDDNSIRKGPGVRIDKDIHFGGLEVSGTKPKLCQTQQYCRLKQENRKDKTGGMFEGGRLYQGTAYDFAI